MRITIPDDLADEIQALRSDRPLDDLVEKLLRRFLHVPLNARTLVLTGRQRQAIERLLQAPGLESGDQLVDLLKARQSTTLGGVRIDFSEAQQREIARRARKSQVTPEQMLQEIAAETSRLMLDAV